MPTEKIVILGGGLAGLSTAFWLTEKPGWKDEYEIVVYQMGWRLGGKCASARNVTPGYGGRIEEHGLHMFFGFYENAFLTMRRVFKGLNECAPPPVATFTDWEDAFKPHALAILPEYVDGQWSKWPIIMPPRPGEPGRGETSSPWEMVRDLVVWLEDFYQQFLLERLGAGSYRLAPWLPGFIAGPLARATNASGSAVGSLVERILPGLANDRSARGERQLSLLTRVTNEMLRLARRGLDPLLSGDDRLRKLAGRHLLPDWVLDVVDAPLDDRLGRLDASFIRILRSIAESLPDDPTEHDDAVWDFLADAMHAFLDLAFCTLAPFAGFDEMARRARIMLDLGGTTVIGLMRDRVLARGFEAFDDEEFRAWLRRHGARPETLDSRLLLAWYDMAFAFEGGDVTRPNAAAGTSLLGMLRLLFGYKGSFAYKMQAGMGDTICTPLYGLLRERGVRFEFFHRVDQLVVDPIDRTLIREVHLTQQAELTPAAKLRGYDPLVRVGTLDCWPSEPDVSQIVNGAAVKAHPAYPVHLESNRMPWPGAPQLVLRNGVEFDRIVLAIPVGALGRICADLIAKDDAWSRMVHGDPATKTPPVGTVRTLALQLWMKRLPLADARARAGLIRRNGWEPTKNLALTGGYAEPFDTWCDMSQLLDCESWPEDAEVGGVLYCCGPMPDAVGPEPTDPQYLVDESLRVRDTARQWLLTNWGPLWPEFVTRATPPAGQWGQVLVDPGVGPGDAFDRQYFRANVDPSERYVACFARTTKVRLPANGSSFRNLVLAGDWVRNPVLSAGAAEPTISSGMAASRAISKFPETIYGEGFATALFKRPR